MLPMAIMVVTSDVVKSIKKKLISTYPKFYGLYQASKRANIERLVSSKPIAKIRVSASKFKQTKRNKNFEIDFLAKLANIKIYKQ